MPTLDHLDVETALYYVQHSFNRVADDCQSYGTKKMHADWLRTDVRHLLAMCNEIKARAWENERVDCEDANAPRQEHENKGASRETLWIDDGGCRVDPMAQDDDDSGNDHGEESARRKGKEADMVAAAAADPDAIVPTIETAQERFQATARLLREQAKILDMHLDGQSTLAMSTALERDILDVANELNMHLLYTNERFGR